MPLIKKPTNRAFGPIFDQVAGEYDKICNAYSLERRRDFIGRHAQGKILEVGAANGVICEALAASHEITVCDISPEMCRMAEQKGLRAVCCDAENLPFENQNFHTVIATEVLYYFDRPERFVKEAARVLKPGGKLLITLPSLTGQMADRLRHVLRKLGFSQMYFDDGIRKFLPLKKVRQLFDPEDFSKINLGRMILLPRKQFHRLNRLVESSPLRRLSLFITAVAEKKICAA